jgi:hypothetical protein
MMTTSPEILNQSVWRLGDGVQMQVCDGKPRLRSPALRRSMISRFFARCLRRPERVEIELDDIGSFVISHLDGRSLGSLAEVLADHLRLNPWEARAALAAFLTDLLKRKLVIMQLAGGSR